MRRYLNNFLIRCKLKLLQNNEVAQVDGIIVVDLLPNSTRFRDCVLAALEQVKSCDPLRYRRIHRRLSWVVNRKLTETGMAEYHHDTRSCEIDFDGRLYETDPDASIALCGATLVHEATHGTFRSHGILYTSKLRSRIERLCVAEQNRFLDHLAESESDLAGRIRYDFDESLWHSAWKTTPIEKLFRILRRYRTE